MTRVVVDTNVVVSGLLNEHGFPAAVLFSLASGQLTWCVFPAILAEYRDVLHRPKFQKIPRGYITALLELAGNSHTVTPTFTRTIASAEPDNRFLECAEAA